MPVKRPPSKVSRKYVPENLPPRAYTQMPRSVLTALGAFLFILLLLALLTALGVLFL